MMEQNNLIENALGKAEAASFEKLKTKFDSFTISQAELAEFNRMRRSIERYKKRSQSDSRLTDFSARVAELLAAGVKRTILLRLVKTAGSKTVDSEVITSPIAVFPELLVEGKPFAYAAGRRYGARGDAAQAYAMMKKRGYDFFVAHLNEAGKAWMKETVMVGERGRGGSQ